MKRSAALIGAVALALGLAGCASTSADAGVQLPPTGAAPDYQLGGAYEPDARVGIVARDRTAEPAAGLYSICYLNGFQTQPGERDVWPDDLVLRRDGADVTDPDWPDEALLDTRGEANRAAFADRMGEWITECAAAGFDAVEFDNLDTYARSDGDLSVEDNLALAAALVGRAHAAGLAAGQKNAAEDARRLHDEAGFDFAVVEECAVFDECGAYIDVYGDAVVAIEYTDELPRPFAEMCADPAAPASLVLRDRDLTVPGDPDYAFELCP